MQNMSGSQLRESFAFSRRNAVLFCAALLALACALVALAPGQAHAKSYTMPKVDIQAQVETDGALQVTEQRTFDFDGDFSAVWWAFDGLPQNASLKINGVRMANVDADGTVVGDWTTLPSEAFVLGWRESGGPGKDSYSFDAPKNSVYVFFNASDDRRIIELDYTVVNGAQAYSDIGEVYWKYVGSQWKEASDNVTMTLALPVPQGTEVVPGENVRAWGHGPLDGKVTVNADGTVTYAVPHVAAGQFAEARVAFPVKWLTNLSPESAALHQGENRLDTVLKEEKDWSDQANRTRVLSLAFVIGCGVVCVLLLAWALRAYFKYGREYQPRFTDEYWRDVPDPSIHPAAIGRLWRWDRESQDDFTATLMHLAHVGAIRIAAGGAGRVRAHEDRGRLLHHKAACCRQRGRSHRSSGVGSAVRHVGRGRRLAVVRHYQEVRRRSSAGVRRLDAGLAGRAFGGDEPRGFLRGERQAIPGLPHRACRGGRFVRCRHLDTHVELHPSDIHDSHRHRVGRDRELHAASQCEGQRADGQEQGAAQLADRLLVS